MTRAAYIDRIIACLLLPIVMPILAVLFVVAMFTQGRPFIFASERMRNADQSFVMYKIRTMEPAAEDGGEGVFGGHFRGRVTRFGAMLRRFRLDELPQIFNVIRGDICFIGPRPPLRKHVAQCPTRYRKLLATTQPGITGLSTTLVHAREERLLSRCRTSEEAEQVYRERCLPVKLRLDLIYQRQRCLALDLMILWRTFSGLGNFGAKAKPRQRLPKQSMRPITDSV